MIVCVSPTSSSADHTINTLRYADRLKANRINYVDDPVDEINNSYEYEEEDEQQIINKLK